MKTKFLFPFLFFLIAFTINVNANSLNKYKLNETEVDAMFDNSIAVEADYTNVLLASGLNTPLSQVNDGDKRILIGVAGILCGGIGLHRFLLGHTTMGLIYLGWTLCAGTIVTILSGGILFAAGYLSGLLGLVDGIFILLDETGTKYNDKKKNLIIWADALK